MQQIIKKMDAKFIILVCKYFKGNLEIKLNMIIKINKNKKIITVLLK